MTLLYKKLIMSVEQPLKSFVLSDKDERQMFKRNPVRNPVTGDRIERDGVVYRRLAEKYGDSPPVVRAIRSDRHVMTDKRRIIKELFRKSALFDFTLSLRRLRAEIINETLREFDLDKWNHCLFPNAEFRKKFDASKLIGRGTFGKVYLLKYKRVKFIIKEAVIESDFIDDNLKWSPPGTQKWDEWAEDSYPEELDAQLTVNEALDQRLSPHFIYTVGGGLCHDCQFYGDYVPANENLKKCYIVAMEAADSNLDDRKTKFSHEIIANFMQQLLLGLTVLHGRFGINHQDIKAQNILVKRVPSGGHFRYEYPERTFYVANMGYVLMLSDYGVSWMMQRSYNKRSRFYGMRNAVFKRNKTRVGWGKNAGEEYTLQPYNTKYIPDFNAGSTKVETLKPNDDFNEWFSGDDPTPIGEFTVNWMCDVDLEPDVSLPAVINTRNMPAWQFAGDIQDALRTLVGGERWFLPDDHKRFNFDTKNKPVWYRRVLKMASLDFDGPELFNTDGKRTAPYLLADVTLARLFPETSMPLKTPLLDVYRWNGT